MWDWLEWPGWAGIGGIAAALALVAVAVAVIDFMLRQQGEAPRAVATTLKRSAGVTNGYVDITVDIRPMGPKILYEAEMRSWGMDYWSSPGVEPVLDSKSEPVSVDLHVRADALEDAWIGLAWVEPRRTRSQAGAARVNLGLGQAYEFWKPYAWPRWPRRVSGRWVRPKEHRDGTPNLLLIP